MEKNEIIILYGENISEMAARLAEEANLADLIGDRKKYIGLKPNLVVASPAFEGATTHTAIAAGLIDYLKKHGFFNISIIEGSWTGGSTSQAFNMCGYTKLAKDTGVRLIDTKKDSTRVCDCAGMEIEICESALNMDFMINLPVMKGHCQTHMTCALKNNKGIISDHEKRRFHSLGLFRPIAHLNTVARNDFILVDGICGDLDFEQGGNPVYSGRLIAARDPVLCDAWAAGQMGFELSEIPYIGMAEELKVGSADLGKAVIRELNSAIAQKQAVSGKLKHFIPYISENNACSACYAALIFALSRMGRNELGTNNVSRFNGKICVGQGFKGTTGNTGVGQCTKDFKNSCPGCPPSGADVLAFLRREISG
ncbi:MAG: DUF362 domain-containing protein [Treponema sp.]|jgi:uncharacterized protein (DUF362 family)|nr:DUF362 domain-containing protein [Treponema sp.]